MTENSAYIEYLRTQFEMIRDERRTSANTATRIGTAFLDLLGLVELHDDTPWETIEDPETGEKSAHLREGYDGAWTEGYLSALGRGNEDDEGSALLFDPLASINEANLGMPMEAGVGIVWNGLRWEYGKTGGGGFSSISQDGLSLTFSGDGLQSQTISLSHTHNVSDLTNDLGFVTSDTLSVLLAEKVDVTWFSRLFKAYNGSTEVTPNQNGTIDNIKAMFGFWTEQYLSALGRGSNASSMLDETMMWALLGSSGNQQIDISHLQSALGTFMPQGVLISVARGSADGKIDFVGSGPGNVYTVDFIHTHAFSDITGRPTTLAGYGITDAYTMTQTDALLAAKVDVSWFRTLFKAYNSSGTEITPNSAGTIDNIQAMVGFWTDQYISALGRGSAGSTLLDEALMWSLLANSDTTKQISLSHLTTALSSYAQTANVITSVAKHATTDGKINFISQAQTYTVDFNHTHQWAQITGQPTRLSQFQNDVPYATSAELTAATSALSYFNAISRVSDGKLRWSGQNAQQDVDFIHTHAFSDITGRPTTLAGYGITDAYTMTQTDALLATKVDVSWFRTLFKAYSSNGTEITPNAAGTIDNIQAMVGFWTNQYISALGRGSTGSTMLDEALMWSILANSDTTKQISLSHLTTALSSYAQTTNVITSVSKNSTDGKINFISQAQTYTVDFIHTHAFTDITGKPTTLAGYGITDAAAKIHTHDIYLGTTKLTTGNAAGSVSSITGMSSVNTDALVLRQITYNSQTVNAVGIGMTPSYPLDVAKRARFADGLYLYESNANLRIGASRLLFSGSGIADSYIRKGSSYLALSSSSSGENGLVVYNTNEVRFTAGAWSDGYLSALGQNSSSDQRLKTELGKVDLKLGNIANAPMVRYFWTAKPWLGDQAGSYAQYWQTILPETVKEGRDGYLEMQYGVIALLSVIATARCVEDHERRIKVLEEENKQLKKQLKSYGYAI